MKVCLVSSLMVCGLQATHLLRLFHHNNNLLPGTTTASLFTFNTYFGANSGNTNNNGGGGGGSSQSGQASYSGQIATGGNNGVTRQVPP